MINIATFTNVFIIGIHCKPADSLEKEIGRSKAKGLEEDTLQALSPAQTKGIVIKDVFSNGFSVVLIPYPVCIENTVSNKNAYVYLYLLIRLMETFQ